MSTIRDRAGFALFGATIELVLARSLSQAGLAVAVILIARETGVAGLGRYALLTAAGSVMVSSVWSGGAVLATRHAGSTASWSSGLVRKLSALSVAGAAGVLLTGWLAGEERWTAASLIAAMAYLVSGGVAFASGVLCGLGRIRHAAIGEGIAGVLLPVLTGVALALGLRLTGALLAIAAASAVALAVMARGLPRSSAPTPSWASLWPFVLMGLASAGYARLDALAIRVATPVETIGLYSAAYRLLGPLLIGASAFGSVYLARLSSGAASGDRADLRRGSMVLFGVLAPVAAVEMAAAPWLIRVLYGGGFEAAVTPARVLLLSALPLALYWPRAHALNAAGRERTWAALLAGAAGVDAVAAGGAARAIGASGAAWAWVGTEVLLAASVLWVIRR